MRSRITLSCISFMVCVHFCLAQENKSGAGQEINSIVNVSYHESTQCRSFGEHVEIRCAEGCEEIHADSVEANSDLTVHFKAQPGQVDDKINFRYSIEPAVDSMMITFLLTEKGSIYAAKDQYGGIEINGRRKFAVQLAIGKKSEVLLIPLEQAKVIHPVSLPGDTSGVDATYTVTILHNGMRVDTEEIKNLNTITYSNLPPGDFILEFETGDFRAESENFETNFEYQFKIEMVIK